MQKEVLYLGQCSGSGWIGIQFGYWIQIRMLYKLV
jgi:hypothetical protein